jgi:hypothetical protein
MRNTKNKIHTPEERQGGCLIIPGQYDLREKLLGEAVGQGLADQRVGLTNQLINIVQKTQVGNQLRPARIVLVVSTWRTRLFFFLILFCSGKKKNSLVKTCTIFSLRFYHTQRRTVMCPFIKQFGIILAQNSILRNSLSKISPTIA